MLLNHPTKISDIAFYKPGNNRVDIVHLIGADIFTNKKYEQTLSSSDYVMVPKV
jgi:translation elongation factor P/translation initiation factor 5A